MKSISLRNFITPIISVVLACLFGTVVYAIQPKKIIEQHKVSKKIEEKQGLTKRLEQAARSDQPTWLLFIIAFLSGILISFTPCVYPMIPITVSIMHGSAATSLLRNFLNACAYVAGMAVIYASLGYFAATSTMIFGRWTANPWVVGFTILFFLYFAFSMFGFYELYVPRFLQQRGEVKTQGSLLRIFLFGLITGTIASPCLTPGLAALLALAAKIGNPIIGFLLLFIFSLGMGAILILIGTFSGALALLPRSGEWLNDTKRIMGFLLLAMCVYFSQHFMSDVVAWSLYGLVAASALTYGIWRLSKKLNRES